jgi:mannonate dehydratase
MGELFTHPNEWVGLISEKLIDFIRVHISMVGGLTPMEKIATLAEWFDVRTAWHAPPDLSPIGHAANAHLDLSTRNFGIQESIEFNEATREVFPGTPVIKNGFIHINEAPGFGVDINEEVAKKYPFPEHPGYWEPVRRGDGTPIKL